MRLLLFATASAIATLAPLSAPALQIETRYYGPGQMIPSIGVAGDRPETAAGGGDLASIVRAAADAWESLIFDQHSLTLHFGWYPTTNVSNSAYHTAGAWGGSPLREVSGSLAFNNEPGGPRVFLDPTPYTAEEFSLTRRGFGQYGDAVLEDTRTFEAVTEEAIGRNDLYTAALHEIGHALGLTLGDAFLMETYDGDIDLLDTPYEGGVIPVKHTHLDTESSLLSAAPRWLGERRGVTQVDLLAVCQVSGFTGCAADLAPADYAGDANGDNRVDAADYVALRNDPTPLGPEYQVWQDNFGQTFELPPGGEAASVLAGVPEPATAALTAAATLALSVRRRTAQPSGRASRGRSQAASPPRAPSPWCV